MKRLNNTIIINELLKIIAIGGVIVSGAFAPNIIKLLGPKVIKLIDKLDKQKEARRLAQYLKDRDYIEVTEFADGQYRIEITEKGKTRLQKVYWDSLEIPKLRRWDRKWRVVSFDIPVKYNTARHSLSNKLRELGFYRLHHSLWVYPFPCRAQIELIKSVYPEIRTYVVVMTVEDIDKHANLVRHFKYSFK